MSELRRKPPASYHDYAWPTKESLDAAEKAAIVAGATPEEAAQRRADAITMTRLMDRLLGGGGLYP